MFNIQSQTQGMFKRSAPTCPILNVVV